MSQKVEITSIDGKDYSITTALPITLDKLISILSSEHPEINDTYRFFQNHQELHSTYKIQPNKNGVVLPIRIVNMMDYTEFEFGYSNFYKCVKNPELKSLYVKPKGIPVKESVIIENQDRLDFFINLLLQDPHDAILDAISASGRVRDAESVAPAIRNFLMNFSFNDFYT